MGKFEKNRKTEFDDIQSVFAKRDQGRAARQTRTETEPRPGDFQEAPVRIRADADYSVESMRQVHEGRAVYDDTPQYRQSSAVRNQQPTYVQEPYYEQPQPYAPPRRRKKKRSALRVFLRIVGVLLALVIAAGIASVIFAKMPESEQSIGARRDGCCTVLLCGTDEAGTRTDTMLLLYLDRNGKKIRLLSLPRDTMVNRDNPVPKLNGAYGANGKGEKGMNMLMDYVKDLVGFRPDGYMLIDLNCFEDLVDAMGGVTFDVPMDMYYNDPSQDLFIDLKEGTQELNGQQAMWLVRFRSGYKMADLERVRVQRDFLGAAVSQWKSLSRLPRAPYAAILLMKNTETDLSYRNLCWIALTLARSGGNDPESDTLPGEPAWIKGGAYYVQNRQKTADLVNEKYNPFEKEIQANDLHPSGY